MASIEDQIRAAEEKAEALRTKLKQLKAKQEQQAARELNRMLKGQRAEDTRRKILVGALIMQQVENGEVDRNELMALLDGYLTRNDDRALFDLPPKQAATPTANKQA